MTSAFSLVYLKGPNNDNNNDNNNNNNKGKGRVPKKKANLYFGKGGVTCIFEKFGHQVAPLALVRNLATRWRHLHCHIAVDFLIDGQY